MDLEGRGKGHNSIQEQTARSLLFALALESSYPKRYRNSYYARKVKSALVAVSAERRAISKEQKKAGIFCGIARANAP